jgi:sugar-specific transcriptional regulator TrmB
MIQKVLKELGLSDNAIQIYLKLAELGFSSARQLAESLGLPRATVYDNLKILSQNGLVAEKEEDAKKLFGIDDPKNLEHLLNTKIEGLKKASAEIKKWLPKLNAGSALEPKIKFYSGIRGIKQVLSNLLWYEDIETLTMWPISEMVEILGVEYLENLNRRRIKQGISIRGIWPADKTVNFKDYPYLGVGKGHLRQLRLAPEGVSWDMSYWLYADKVAFISSKAESYGFVINSRDFANLIRAQFEIIWKLSKPIKSQPQYTDQFLKTF